MEIVLLMGFVVDLILAFYMLWVILYLSNKIKALEDDLQNVKEIVEINSDLLARRSDDKRKTWR